MLMIFTAFGRIAKMMTNGRKGEGFLDAEMLYRLFEQADSGPPSRDNPAFFENDFQELIPVETVPEIMGSYLRKEDIILSLARERTSKMKRHFKEGETFFSIFNEDSWKKKADYNYLIKTIHSKVVKPEISQIIKNHNIMSSLEGQGQIVDWFRNNVGADLPKLNFNLTALEKAVLREKVTKGTSTGVRMTSNRGYSVCLALNGSVTAKNKQRFFSWRDKRDTECVYLTDGECLAEAVFIYQCDLMFRRRCESLSVEHEMEDIVYRTMWEGLKKRINDCTCENGFVLVEDLVASHELLDFLVENGYRYRILERSVYNSSQEKAQLFGYLHLAYYAPFQTELPRFWYTYAPEKNDDGLSTYRWRLQAVYFDMFKLLFEEWTLSKKNVQFLIQQKELAATVFQTKKNIPAKYQQVMENSIFNDTYGYVEIDEECDLKLFHEIELEYLALKRTCFRENGDYKGIALRFRKLGRYRAAGIYFPGIGCQCVDIRYPSSFVHEYLHMVDDISGQLSDKYQFLAIREHYSMALKEQLYKLPDGDPMRERLLGHSKYNLDYYCQPTEIFARCGEMYFTSCHQIKNSLLKPEEGIQYPREDDVLLLMLKDYYSKIFPVLAEDISPVQTANR